MNQVLVLPDNREIHASYWSKITRHMPEFSIVGESHVFHFVADRSAKTCPPFARVIRIKINGVGVDVVVGHELWNQTFHAYAGDEDLTTLPRELAQAVIDAGARKVFGKLSALLKAEIVVEAIDLKVPDLASCEHVSFQVKAAASQGQVTFCFHEQDLVRLEEIIKNLWPAVKPHCSPQSYRATLEAKTISVPTELYLELEAGDVIFLDEAPDRANFTLRLTDELCFAGNLADGVATLGELRLSQAPCSDEDLVNLTLEYGALEIEVQDASEIMNGYQFSWPKTPETLTIREGGILIGKAQPMTLQGRPALMIEAWETKAPSIKPAKSSSPIESFV